MGILTWNERWTTFAVEVISLGLLAGVGVAYMMEAWPKPWLPAVWSGSVFVIFIAYRALAFARQRFFPPKPAPEPQESEETPKLLSMKWSAVEPNLAADDPVQLKIPAKPGESASAEAATAYALTAVLRDDNAAETMALDAVDLRPETEEDLMAPDAQPIPLFAESGMSTEQRTMTLQAVGSAHSPKKAIKQPNTKSKKETREEKKPQPNKPIDNENAEAPTALLDAVDPAEGPTTLLDAVPDGEKPANQTKEEAADEHKDEERGGEG